MDNNQELSLELKATINEALKGIDSLVNKLNSTEKGLNSVNKALNDTDKKISNISSNSNKLGNTLKKVFSLGAINKTMKSALSALNLSIDRSEQLNLFNVVFKNMEKNGVKTFSELGKEATKFQNKLNEVFGTNKTETLKYQGLFQSMGENVGIDDKHSAIMSETMTKLTYDLASLYNKDESTVAEALRAGVYAGQTKPLRSYGIDVTQTSMAPILNELGIDDRSVKQMSQAEKEILRYIAALKQAKTAMGDYANTIDSPANQQKVFKNLIVETRVAIGDLVTGVFANLLPVVNGVLMVIKELAIALAKFLGIKVSDYNTGIATQTDLYGDLSDSIDDAAGSAKELKRQTLGFDQIHNINENKDSGNSSYTGIDSRLLDAIKGYDNGMDKARMKAIEIRDAILDWLGYTDGTYKNLKLIGGVLGIIAGFKILKGIKGLITGSSTLGKVLGTGGLLGVFKNIKSYGANILSGIKMYKEGIISLKTLLQGTFGVVTIGLGGIASLVAGGLGIKKQFDELDTSIAKTTLHTAEMVAGGAALGSVLPGIGTLAGAAAGGIASIVVAAIEADKQLTQLAYNQIFGTLNVSVSEWSDILKNSYGEIDNLGTKLEELQTDLETTYSSFKKNGEEVELYGTKMSLMGEKISKEDSQKFIDAINNMADEATSIITESGDFNLETISNVFKRSGGIIDEEEKNILQKVMAGNEARKKDIAEAQNNITRTYENAIQTRGYLTDEEYNYIQEQLRKIRELTANEMSKNQTDIEYFKRISADKNLKLDEQSYSNFQKALDKYYDERMETISTNYNIERNALENALKDLDDTNITGRQKIMEKIKALDKERQDNEDETNRYIEEARNTVIGNLEKQYLTATGKQKDILNNTFKNLNIDTSEIYRKYADIGKTCAWEFNSELSKGLKNSKVTIPEFNYSVNVGYSYSNPYQQYASGGIPSQGTRFIAGEDGPEIVGHINGRTEVLNQSQLADVMYSAVTAAMSQANRQPQEIRVYAEEGIMVEKVSNGINNYVKQTGSLPFSIPA